MEKLLEILRKINPEIDYENNKHLVEEGLLDSLEIVEIITSLEEMFGIEISPDQIDPDNFESAEAMWEMVQRGVRRKDV